MNLPKYDNYKDSGVEWLGTIPEHWTLSHIRAVTELKSVKNQPNLPILSVYREFGVIPKDSRDDNHNATSLDTSTYKVVEMNDLVVNKMKAWQGSMGVSKYQGLVSPAYITCKVETNTVYPDFLHYLLRSKIYISTYNALSYGVRVGQWDMHYEDFKKIPIVFPNIAEQRRITEFLDRKCEEIDEAIRKKQRLIELLEEQKTILINQAVTKGLDLNVPMKESGIDWLSEIPEHWDRKQLGRIGRFQNGISEGADYFGTGYPFVNYTDVYKNNRLPEEVTGLANSSTVEREKYSVQKGDVLFTRTSEIIEEIGLASTCLETIENAIFSGFLIRFRPRKNILNRNFSKYYFRAGIHRFFFVKEMNLVTRASLSQDLLKKTTCLNTSCSRTNGNCRLSRYCCKSNRAI